jgi:hypothetical protein
MENATHHPRPVHPGDRAKGLALFTARDRVSTDAYRHGLLPQPINLGIAFADYRGG